MQGITGHIENQTSLLLSKCNFIGKTETHKMSLDNKEILPDRLFGKHNEEPERTQGGGPSVRTTTGFAEVRKLELTWNKGGIPEEKDKRGASKMGGLG